MKMNLPQSDTMIPLQEVYRLRIVPFVERVMANNRQLYIEKHSAEEWINYVMEEMDYLSLEKLLTIPEEDLRGRIGRAMVDELAFGMLNDLTPEQLKVFDEATTRNRLSL